MGTKSGPFVEAEKKLSFLWRCGGGEDESEVGSVLVVIKWREAESVCVVSSSSGKESDWTLVCR